MNQEHCLTLLLDTNMRINLPGQSDFKNQALEIQILKDPNRQSNKERGYSVSPSVRLCQGNVLGNAAVWSASFEAERTLHSACQKGCWWMMDSRLVVQTAIQHIRVED